MGVGMGCEVGEFGVCMRHHEGQEWVGEGPGLGCRVRLTVSSHADAMQQNEVRVGYLAHQAGGL